jgi:hypothetical protein
LGVVDQCDAGVSDEVAGDVERERVRMIGVDRHGSGEGDQFHEAVTVLVEVEKRSGSDVAGHEGGHASGSAHAFASELHVAGESEGFV